MLTTSGSFKPIVERTAKIIDVTLHTVPQLKPGERQADPTSTLKLGELPNRHGRSRVSVCLSIDPKEVTRFAREQNELFDSARDVLDFSGERIHPVPEVITALAKPLPLTHLMPAEQVAFDYGNHGLTVTDEGVRLKGLDYLMQLRPLHRTLSGGTTGWNTQQPHFHQSPEEFHDQRLLHGPVPERVTVVLITPHGAQVISGGKFGSIQIGPRAAYQFLSIHDELLELEPDLHERLQTPGPLEPRWLMRLHTFLDKHKEIPFLEFDSLTKSDLAAASALVVSSHTKDPESSGADGENLMADQTMGVKNPEQFGTFVPWTAPPLPDRPRRA